MFRHFDNIISKAAGDFVVGLECFGKAWLPAILAAAAGGPLIILLFLFAIWCVGFTAAGVAGGSLAAVTQSSFPLVPAQSLFALFQSIGALGVNAFHPPVYFFCSTVCVVVAVHIMWLHGCRLNDACACHT